MKLRLNVATAPHENNRPFVAGVLSVGAIALIALFVLSRVTYVSWRSNLELRSDTARLRQQISIDNARQQDLQNYFNRQEVKQVMQKAEFLNSLISERSFPWTKIFMDLEQTLPPGVHVISIAPKLVNGRADVSMVVGASSDAAKIQFLEALEKSKSFANVTEDDERPSELPGDSDRVIVKLDFWYETI
jgi:Tfp pilus assembly protein PilN